MKLSFNELCIANAQNDANATFKLEGRVVK